MFAASSTVEAVEEIAKVFEQENSIHIEINLAASSTLAQQISAGADADIFISANQQWADYLQKKNLIERQENILQNRLVLISPANAKESIHQVTDLLSPGIKTIAMGETETVPVGMYAKKVLVQMNLWDKIRTKVISGSDARQVLFYVERGETDCGIVYKTDAMHSKKVHSADIELPADIAYPFAIIKKEQVTPEAISFYEFLLSSKSKELFEKHGFIFRREIQ